MYPVFQECVPVAPCKWKSGVVRCTVGRGMCTSYMPVKKRGCKVHYRKGVHLPKLYRVPGILDCPLCLPASEGGPSCASNRVGAEETSGCDSCRLSPRSEEKWFLHLTSLSLLAERENGHRTTQLHRLSSHCFQKGRKVNA